MARKKEGRRRSRPSLAEVVFEIGHDLECPTDVFAFLGRLVYAGFELDTPTTERALELLEDSGLVVTAGRKIIPKAAALAGSCVLAQLSEDELRDGVVFPLQRLMGLAPPWVPVADYRFRAPDGTTYRQRRMTRSIEEVAAHSSLLIPDDLLTAAARDEPAAAAARGQEYIDLPAVEISELLAGAGDEDPSFVKFQLESFLEARFGLSLVPAAELRGRDKQVRRWIEWMDRELMHAFERYGPNTDAATQLSFAYVQGPKTMRLHPRLALEQYLELTDKVAAYTSNGVPILWYADAEPEPEMVFPGFAPARGDRDSLDAIFEDLGIDLTASELTAFFRDAVLRGEAKPEAPLSRALAGREMSFHDALQRESFEELVGELWERLMTEPVTAAERVSAGLRARILGLIVTQRRWLVSLDRRGIDPVEFPMDETSRLAQLSGRLKQFIELLNAPESLDEFTLKRYEPLVERLAEALEAARAQVQAALEPNGLWETPETRRAQFEVVRPEVVRPEVERTVETGPQSESGAAAKPDKGSLFDDGLPALPRRPPSRWRYRLEVMLSSAAPLIRREVELPGTITLCELQVLVHQLFGWHGYSPHVFEIGERTYTPRGEVDAHRHFLQDVAPPAGGEFHCVHCCDLEWRIRLTVMQMTPAPEPGVNPDLVRCVSAGGADPPQDIGCIDAYRDILNAASDPSHEEYAFAAEWLGPDFDPEFVDLDTINRRLREFGYRRGLSD